MAFEAADWGEFALRFDNAQPIRASDFAKVVRDLSSDYKRIYKEELAISAVNYGSLIAKFQSFSKTAESANHIFEFAKNIAWLVGAGTAATFAVGHITDQQDSPPLSSH